MCPMVVAVGVGHVFVPVPNVSEDLEGMPVEVCLGWDLGGAF